MIALTSANKELLRARRIIGELGGIDEGSSNAAIRRARSPKKSKRRGESFDRDYPTFLLSLGSAIRTGQDPLNAVSKVGELFPKNSPIAEEITAFKENIERGIHEDECIRKFGSSSSHPDLHLFRTALLLARKHGSSLSKCLERLVKVTRQRQSFRRKVRSAIAMQKLSSLGIGFCAVIICLFQIITNSQGLMEAVHHPAGSKLLVASLVLIFFGIGWMLRIAAREV